VWLNTKISFPDAISFTLRKKHWPITKMLLLIRRVYSNRAWKVWACRLVQIEKHPQLVLCRQRWRMFKINRQIALVIISRQVQRTYFRIRLVHQTVRFSMKCQHLFHHRRHCLNNSHLKYLGPGCLLSPHSLIRLLLFTSMWWNKFQKIDCQSLIKSVLLSIRWVLSKFNRKGC